MIFYSVESSIHFVGTSLWWCSRIRWGQWQWNLHNDSEIFKDFILALYSLLVVFYQEHLLFILYYWFSLVYFLRLLNEKKEYSVSMIGTHAHPNITLPASQWIYGIFKWPFLLSLNISSDNSLFLCSVSKCFFLVQHATSNTTQQSVVWFYFLFLVRMKFEFVCCIKLFIFLLL